MKKFLCYDTNDAASGKINVSSNGVLKPDAVFYVNVNTLVDADGNYITYEQAKAAGLNCVIVPVGSPWAVYKPTMFGDHGGYISYQIGTGDVYTTFHKDPEFRPA